jgi:phospholipid/cholesterol/gamma-HCH transport system substrate-binding protein
MSRELRVGIFLGGVILIVAAFIFIVGDMSALFQRPGYSLLARFDSAAGLDEGAEVKMAGVLVGRVKAIRLARRRAEVELKIYPTIEVPEDSKVTLSVLGLLGEKYVEIIPGQSAKNCAAGDELGILPSIGFDQIGPLLQSVGDEVKEAGAALKEVLGPATRESLNKTLESLASLAAELRDVVGAKDGDFRKTIAQAGRTFEDLNRKIEDISAELSDSIRVILEIASENRENLKVDLESIKELIGRIEESVKLLNSSLEKINRGEGTIGKLVNEPDLYTRAEDTIADVQRTVRPLAAFRAAGEIRADYFGKSDLVRPAVSLGLWAGPSNFLWAGLVRNPWEKRLEFTLQGGRRWGPIAPRIGFLESEFGVGLDCYTLQDRLIFSFEGFDFNRETQPHFRVMSRFLAFGNVRLIAGLDDFSLAARREFFFGLGVELR